jgi:hypothetical protein
MATITLSAQDIDFITARPTVNAISRIGPAKGKALTVIFHLKKSVFQKMAQGHQIPPSIAVGINGEAFEAIDLSGSGVYTAYVSLDALPTQGKKLTKKDLQNTTFAFTSADPLTNEFEKTNIIVPPDIKFKIKIKIVPCPNDCRSIIFGTKCLLCVMVEVEFG